MAVDGHLGHAGPLDDRVDADGPDAMSTEEGVGRRQDPLPRASELDVLRRRGTGRARLVPMCARRYQARPDHPWQPTGPVTASCCTLR